jgi:hypothetical protein
MNVVILILAVAAVVSLGFVAGFVMLLIGMRAEGSRLQPISACHTRTAIAARRLLGVSVRRELEKSPVQYDDVRR